MTLEQKQQLLFLSNTSIAAIVRGNHATYETSVAAIRAALEEIDRLTEEVGRLRTRLLSAAGDDLCRLTQDEIKELTSGAVKIPPKDEFLASCERFHEQIASGPGVLNNCLTLAQLIAENERLTAEVARFRHLYESQWHPKNDGFMPERSE